MAFLAPSNFAWEGSGAVLGTGRLRLVPRAVCWTWRPTQIIRRNRLPLSSTMSSKPGSLQFQVQIL